jgi:hypothetical protein
MTALNKIVAGSRILASEIQAVAPLAAVKGTDQSVTSSTVLVNDNTLFVPVLASVTYFLILQVIYEGGTQGSSDLKFAWTAPSGAAMSVQQSSITTAGGSTIGFVRGLSGSTAGTSGAGNKWGLQLTGTFSTSSTAGTLQFQWAQNTSNGTATIVHAQSALCLWQDG